MSWSVTWVRIVYGYHVHPTHSNGTFLRWMIEAAADVGLDGIYPPAIRGHRSEYRTGELRDRLLKCSRSTIQSCR